MASYLDEIPDGIALNDTPVETISQAGVIDGSTERFRVKYEFDVNDAAAYEAAWTSYPSAWDIYLGVTGKTFANTDFSGTTTVEEEILPNPVVLQQAINFYIYTTGEDSSFTEAQQEILVTAAVATDSQQFRRLENYIPETGSGIGTYENPNAFYDPDVYNRVVDASDNLPRVSLDGSQTISYKYNSSDSVVNVMTSTTLSRTEYQAVINGPDSALDTVENSGFYDWGGPYATGGKKGRDI